jgi:hypothetical protein
MISRSPLDRTTAFAAPGAVAAPAAVTAAAVFTGWAGAEDETFDGADFAGAFADAPSPMILLSAGVSGVVGASEDLCRRGWRTRRSGARILGLIGRGRVVNVDTWALRPL